MAMRARTIMAVTLRFAIYCREWQHCHTSVRYCQSGILMLKKVVLLAIPGVAPFEFGVICEVFGIDRSDTGGPAVEFRLATADPRVVPTSLGFDLVVSDGLETAADADLIAVPAHNIDSVDERFLRVIRAAEARGA